MKMLDKVFITVIAGEKHAVIPKRYLVRTLYLLGFVICVETIDLVRHFMELCK